MHGALKIITLTPFMLAQSFTASTEALKSKGLTVTIVLTPMPSSTLLISTLSTLPTPTSEDGPP